jgi:DNA-binding beta-propeller fold protein YncE
MISFLVCHIKTTLTSDWRQLLRAFYPFLIAAAALWALPKNASAQQDVGFIGRIFITNGFFENSLVSEYDYSTGKVVNAHFIRGLEEPRGLAVSGNDLFVVERGGRVGKYDARTGGAINAGFITGLRYPEALAVSGDKLLVTNHNPEKLELVVVSEYDATSGKLINADFIAGPGKPTGLAVSGNTLFVANVVNRYGWEI